ncbi:MAG TPA: anti-sigma factor RsbA family regulatory protein [Candidatus Limnocylindrales bacterium]|nr:anti-sigma factor RsbA family regulatory protein [Candidatus Limnocylindrales bacterium]
MTAAGYRHEAMLYAGEKEFLDGTLPFIRDGLRAGEPTLVVVEGHKIASLRARLGDEAEAVTFADMTEVGRNPAWIIPFWSDFLNRPEHAGRPLRGIGEPVLPSRDPDELVECERHEALLNLAVDPSRSFRLLCPYDTSALEGDALAVAERTHPILRRSRQAWESAAFAGLTDAGAPMVQPLPPAPAGATEIAFDGASIGAVRAAVRRHAARAQMRSARIADLVTAVTELAANSVRHGGGRGRLRIWSADGAVHCEVWDRGRITDPLAGRQRPGPDVEAGRGLWLCTRLCDLVQIRSAADGGVVRLRLRCA